MNRVIQILGPVDVIVNLSKSPREVILEMGRIANVYGVEVHYKTEVHEYVVSPNMDIDQLLELVDRLDNNR